MKNLAWLIFIIAKGNPQIGVLISALVRVLQRRGDLVEFAYLLVAILYIVLLYSSSDVSCELLESKI